MLELDKIYCHDCIKLLAGPDASKPFVDLLFADPPFNIGYQYDQYQDKRSSAEYVEWTRCWMQACLNVLKKHGSFYIAIGDDYAAEVRLAAKNLGLHLRNWIIWHYTFGQNTRRKFARSHTHIFYFVKNADNFTFNDLSVRIASARQLVYKDRRANPAGKLPDDVWRYSRVCGTFKERQDWHNCQMPIKLLARIIKASSNPGDVVLDPFSGSGTTLLAAAILKRRYVGIDISKKYANNATKRILNALADGTEDIDTHESCPTRSQSTQQTSPTRTTRTSTSLLPFDKPAV